MDHYAFHPLIYGVYARVSLVGTSACVDVVSFTTYIYTWGQNIKRVDRQWQLSPKDWLRRWNCEQNALTDTHTFPLRSMQNPGFDPGACRLQSDRSSDWASPPWYHCISCSSNKQVSSPTAGIEPATIWLKGQRSTSWATEALINARQSVITCSQILVHEMGFEPTHPKMLRPERTCFDRSATCCALNWWLIHSTVQHSLTKKVNKAKKINLIVKNTANFTKSMGQYQNLKLFSHNCPSLQ